MEIKKSSLRQKEVENVQKESRMSPYTVKSSPNNTDRGTIGSDVCYMER